MDENLIKQRVHDYYWHDDVNCVTTTLKILAEKFQLDLNPQIFDAAIGMHGAGGYRAQCGLVEGGLLFLGIIGRARKMPDELIIELCREYASRFEEQFSSLLCRELRPEGFGDHLPPHLCEPLSCRTVLFTAEFIEKEFMACTK